MLRFAVNRVASQRATTALSVASKRALSSAKPAAGPAVPKEIVPRNAAMGLAAGGLFVLIAAGSGGSAQADNAELLKAQQEEAQQVAEVIALINQRMDKLEQMVEKERAAREEAKRAKDEAAATAAAAEKAAAEAKATEEAKQAVIEAAGATNRAFIFVKPHANTEKVEALVKETLAKLGFSVKTEGVLTAEEIDSKKLIDTHYGAIAGKAVLLKPSELNVPAKGKAQFQETFGHSWEDALSKGEVLNAADACEKLQVDGDQLEALWRKIDKKKLIKFGGGFYCGELQPGLFVINGFYMQMRGKYTRPPAAIRFFEVEWNPSAMPWKAFREQFLGSTDPSKAAEGSLRRVIFDRWQELGLSAQPDTGDNGMHGSASPFEALAEVANWEGKSISEDVFGKGLLAASGLDESTLRLWLADAQVPVEGKPTSIFDTLEDQDSKENLAKVAEIVANLPAKIVQ